jgi:hypothetical protein
MRKSFVKVVTLTAALSMLASSTAFAGQWKQENSTWKYQNDDGSYVTNNWQWIDGKSYCFDSNGNMYANTTTPDGYTVNTDGQWTVDGVIQTQNANNATATSSDEFPLKGRVEKYFGVENGNLVPYWQPAHVINEGVVPAGMTGMTYISQKAVEERDITMLNPTGGYNLAVLAILSGYNEANIPSKDKPETTELLNEVKEFMNSFDWRNASDLEKATRICNRIHQASYDHDAANEADTTGWSNSVSYGAYGCLVKGKAVCQGYTEAAKLLSYAVGIKSFEMGDIGHTYPLFLVDGIWLANEPTTQDKYFTVADVYKYNPIYRTMLMTGADTSNYTSKDKYQVIGDYCYNTGYTMPDEAQVRKFGNTRTVFDKIAIDFKSEYR